MHNKHSPDTERAAECQRLVEELSSFFEELPQNERTFVQDMDERLTKYGEATYVSDKQYNWLTDIYHRIIG